MVARRGKPHVTKPRCERKRSTGCRGARRRFSKAELETFRQRLLNKRRTLVGDIEMIREENGTGRSHGLAVQDSPGDFADMGSSMATLESEALLLEREARLLQEIDDALERIERGTYGFCLATGKPITKARLRAIPWAKYCTEHARAVESNSNPPERRRRSLASVPSFGC